MLGALLTNLEQAPAPVPTPTPGGSSGRYRSGRFRSGRSGSVSDTAARVWIRHVLLTQREPWVTARARVVPPAVVRTLLVQAAPEITATSYAVDEMMIILSLI